MLRIVKTCYGKDIQDTTLEYIPDIPYSCFPAAGVEAYKTIRKTAKAEVVQLNRLGEGSTATLDQIPDQSSAGKIVDRADPYTVEFDSDHAAIIRHQDGERSIVVAEYDICRLEMDGPSIEDSRTYKYSFFAINASEDRSAFEAVKAGAVQFCGKTLEETLRWIDNWHLRLHIDNLMRVEAASI